MKVIRSMRLIVAGSRSFDDYKYLRDSLDRLTYWVNKLTVVSGGAEGADRLGERWACENWWGYEVFHPDYHKHGKVAPLVRNSEMVKSLDPARDGVAVFWDSLSSGTRDLLEKARRAGVKRVKVFDF